AGASASNLSNVRKNSSLPIRSISGHAFRSYRSPGLRPRRASTVASSRRQPDNCRRRRKVASTTNHASAWLASAGPGEEQERGVVGNTPNVTARIGHGRWPSSWARPGHAKSRLGAALQARGERRRHRRTRWAALIRTRVTSLPPTAACRCGWRERGERAEGQEVGAHARASLARRHRGYTYQRVTKVPRTSAATPAATESEATILVMTTNTSAAMPSASGTVAAVTRTLPVRWNSAASSPA